MATKSFFFKVHIFKHYCLGRLGTLLLVAPTRFAAFVIRPNRSTEEGEGRRPEGSGREGGGMQEAEDSSGD